MKFIMATNNAHKVIELSRILLPLGIEVISAKDAGITLDDVEETGTTFAENAFLKANAAFIKTGMPAVADDSGLCVDALDGRPGIYSQDMAVRVRLIPKRMRSCLMNSATLTQKIVQRILQVLFVVFLKTVHELTLREDAMVR